MLIIDFKFVSIYKQGRSFVNTEFVENENCTHACASDDDQLSPK